VLFARGSTTKKYDGTTVRNWGLAHDRRRADDRAVAPDGKTFATCDIAEAPAFTFEEDDGTGATFATGQDGTGERRDRAPSEHECDATAARSRSLRGGDRLHRLRRGRRRADDDLIELYVYVTEPTTSSRSG
jgi:hypothetical protein